MTTLDEERLRLLLGRLAEQVGGSTTVPPRLRKRTRRRLMLNGVAAALGMAAIGLAGVVAVDYLRGSNQAVPVGPDRSSSPAPAPREPRPRTGVSGERVWDGDVAFDLRRLDCGGGEVGDEDSELRARGKFCTAVFSILNRSEGEMELPLQGHLLASGRETFDVWSEGTRELAADDAHSPYRTPVPAGGGAIAAVYFELPVSARPRTLTVHAAEGSQSAVIRLQDCDWNSYRGNVTGGCYPQASRAEIGVEYPHSISTYTSAAKLLQVTCFNSLEWEVVSHATRPPPGGFIGQGTITLVSDEKARFRDNSGIVLELAPSAGNKSRPRTCG